jgi:hypothetical protein
MNPITSELNTLEIAAPVHFRNLTLFPVLRPEPASPRPGYLLLQEAIAQRVARVTELNGGGSVPELRFENSSDQPVLLLDGEELVGAKQNRVLNLTILAPPKHTTILPVSCVEEGRWNFVSPEFAPADRVMYARARAARMKDVSHSLRATGLRCSDQGAVWNEIAAKMESMDAPSPTCAMGDIYARHAVSIEEYLRAFNWQTRQAGVVFAIGGHVHGLDLLDHPAAFEMLLPKLVRSYALDALDSPATEAPPAPRQGVEQFFALLGDTQAFMEPAIGMGKDVRLNGVKVSGAALWEGERYVHLCAFASDNNGSPSPGLNRTRMSRPSRRR